MQIEMIEIGSIDTMPVFEEAIQKTARLCNADRFRLEPTVEVIADGEHTDVQIDIRAAAKNTEPCLVCTVSFSLPELRQILQIAEIADKGQP